MPPTHAHPHRRAITAVMTVLALCASLILAAQFNAPTAHADTTAGSQFSSMAPTTLIDTRNGTGGVPVAKIPAGGSITFQVTGVAGVPDTGVTAAALNLTAATPEAFGWLTVFPSDVPTTTSTLTYQTGETATGEDFTRITDTGKVTVKNNGDGAVHLQVAIRGYFINTTATQTGGEYYPVDNTYLYDTRPGHVAGSPAHDDTPIPANSLVTVDVAGQQGIPATGATAVAINVAVTSQTQKGWITAYPSDQPQPTSATVDFVPGETDSSFAILQLTSTGKITFTNRSSGTIQLLVSVRGFFQGQAEEGGAGYTPTPTNVLVDTLTGAGTPGGSTQPLAANATFTFNVIQAAGLDPLTTSAVALNINGRRPTNQGWLSAYPSEDDDPLTPSVNFDDGGESTNGFDLVTPDSSGNISLTNHSGGTVHLQISLRGYFSTPFEEEGTISTEDMSAVDNQTSAASTTPSRYFVANARRDPYHFYSAPPGDFKGRVWWDGYAPYDIYIDAYVTDGAPDSYCVGALVRMDGHSYTSKSWLDCGADPHYTHMKGWFQRTASYIDFKACLFKKMGNVYHYGYCTSQWK